MMPGSGNCSRKCNPSMNPNPARPPLLTPRFLFIAGSLAVLLALTLSPATRARLGVFDRGQWFLDAHSVLGANDAERKVVGANASGHDQMLLEGHHYSDWWFGLRLLGLTQRDAFLVGGGWVLLFLLAVFATVKPGSRAEALWLVLLTGSPPVLLGVIRANSDLLIFAVLAVAVLALRFVSGRRLVLAFAAVALATGLKFYPVAAGLVFLQVPGVRRMLRATGWAAGLLGAVVASLSTQLHRGIFHVEPEIYTLGGRIWLMDLGLAEQPAILVSLVLLAAAAGVAAWRGWTTGLARAEDDLGGRVAMTLGAALLVFCFLGTINFGYRWVFALWLAPWLWSHRRGSPAARAAVWLLPLILWHDGFLCLATNLWFPHLRQEQYDHILVAWRLVTEPFVWLVMILLAGWLLDLVLVCGREACAVLFPARR